MTILVRRIGFEPADVRLAGMPDTALTIRLTAIPVQLKGVVTETYQARGEVGGFYLQDPGGDGNDETSDGLLVFDNSDQVQPGDVVRVGAIDVELLHTPGHTPEHVSLLVHDRAVGQLRDAHREGLSDPRLEDAHVVDDEPLRELGRGVGRAGEVAAHRQVEQQVEVGVDAVLSQRRLPACEVLGRQFGRHVPARRTVLGSLSPRPLHARWNSRTGKVAAGVNMHAAIQSEIPRDRTRAARQLAATVRPEAVAGDLNPAVRTGHRHPVGRNPGPAAIASR